MEIKTIWLYSPALFDDAVNSAIAEGWRLTRRELVQATEDIDASAFYAELVKLDPPAEPEKGDPFEALRTIQALCMSTSLEDCAGERCPLEGWCSRLTQCADPSDWRLPEREAGT